MANQSIIKSVLRDAAAIMDYNGIDAMNQLNAATHMEHKLKKEAAKFDKDADHKEIKYALKIVMIKDLQERNFA